MRYHCIYLSVLAAVPLGGLAKPLSPRWNDMHTKHSWNAVPKNWESLGGPPSGTTIDLYVALKPHRQNALIDALYEVSSPEHPKYGAHLSKEQVAELVAPHPNTLELVNSWLEHHGIPSSSVSMTHGGNTLMLKGVSVTNADTLLGASYQLYRHVERGETIIRTVGYALPAVLHGHVLTVVPTTSFASPPTRRKTPRNHSGGTATGLVKSGSREPATMLSSRFDIDYVTPDFLRWLYATEEYIPAATEKNRLGIAGYLADYPSPADLEAFMTKYYSDAKDATFAVVPLSGGGYDEDDPTDEGNLDIQYAEAMAYPTPVTFYSTGDERSGTDPDSDDFFVSWLRFILKQRSIPQTISTSYLVDESENSREHSIYVCDLFAQLGARGVSLLFATGDDGVGHGNCVTEDGSVQFIPVFPATCPYVTSIGGTTGFDEEEAAKISGGGFSNHFKRPPYQDKAVSDFLGDLGSRYKGLYNVTGRGIPDMAAQANRFKIFLKGKEEVVSGTSGSTPIVAGVISLLNDYLLSKGKKPLGFLNPWLYTRDIVGLINDITKGSNQGCNTEGFSAITGWDPVTGLGTPDFVSLLHILGQRDQPGPSNPAN